MGITLNTMAGADTTSAGTEPDDLFGATGENYVYNVDVDPAETVTLTGD